MAALDKCSCLNKLDKDLLEMALEHFINDRPDYSDTRHRAEALLPIIHDTPTCETVILTGRTIEHTPVGPVSASGLQSGKITIGCKTDEASIKQMYKAMTGTDLKPEFIHLLHTSCPADLSKIPGVEIKSKAQDILAYQPGDENIKIYSSGKQNSPRAEEIAQAENKTYTQIARVRDPQIAEDLRESIGEEKQASNVYNDRGQYAKDRDDPETAKLYTHIAAEEFKHRYEFEKRLKELGG
jgi:hypothetical protein